MDWPNDPYTMSPDFQRLSMPQQEIAAFFKSTSDDLLESLASLHQKYGAEGDFIRDKLISYSVYVGNLANLPPLIQTITTIGRGGMDKYVSQRSINKGPSDAMGGFPSRIGAEFFPQETVYSHIQPSRQLSVIADMCLPGYQLHMPCTTQLMSPLVPDAADTDMISGQETDNFMYFDHFMGHDRDSSVAGDAQHPTRRQRAILPRITTQREPFADLSDPNSQPCGSNKDLQVRAQKYKEKQKQKCMSLLSIIGDVECVTSADALFRSGTNIDWRLFNLSELTLKEAFQNLHDIDIIQRALVIRRRLVLIRLLEHYDLLKQAIEAEIEDGQRNGQSSLDKLDIVVIDRLVEEIDPKIRIPHDVQGRREWRTIHTPVRKRMSNQLHAARHWKKAVDAFGLGIVLLFPLNRNEVTNTAFETFSDDITQQLLTKLSKKDDGRIPKLAKSWTPFMKALYAGKANANMFLPNHQEGDELSCREDLASTPTQVETPTRQMTLEINSPESSSGDFPPSANQI